MISNADMREDSLLRWINTSYTSDDDLSIKIYRDRSDTADSFSTAMGMTSTLSLPENLEENKPNKKSFHAGLPIIEGTKHIAIIWVRERIHDMYNWPNDTSTLTK